jgi:hypothetical protein
MSESLAEYSAKLKAKAAADQAATEAEIARIREEGRKHREAATKAKAEQEKAREEARQKEAAARFDKEHKVATRRSWIANGGLPSDFDQAWPKLKEEILLEQVRKTETQARAMTTQHARDMLNRF